jgi:hypothetical protein
MIVDIRVALGDVTRWTHPMTWLLRLLPATGLLVGLRAPESVLIERRPDLRSDRRLSAKLAAYETLYRDLGCPVFDTARTVPQVHRAIVNIVCPQGEGKTVLEESAGP